MPDTPQTELDTWMNTPEQKAAFSEGWDIFETGCGLLEICALDDPLEVCSTAGVLSRQRFEGDTRDWEAERFVLDRAIASCEGCRKALRIVRDRNQKLASKALEYETIQGDNKKATEQWLERGKDLLAAVQPLQSQIDLATFQSTCNMIGIGDYAKQIFEAGPHGNRTHLNQYAHLAMTCLKPGGKEAADEFKAWFKETVENIEDSDACDQKDLNRFFCNVKKYAQKWAEMAKAQNG